MNRLLTPMTLVAALAAFSGCKTTRIGEQCDLIPCNVQPGDEPDGANFICDLQVNCDSFTCLSFRADGMNNRAPFCTADCVPDPTCPDPLDPASCGDPYTNCPRDINGNPGVCMVTNEVVGPNEPTNCTVEIAGTTRNARCECVPCCEIDRNLCSNPDDCPG